jgi:hypothetical protein
MFIFMDIGSQCARFTGSAISTGSAIFTGSAVYSIALEASPFFSVQKPFFNSEWCAVVL